MADFTALAPTPNGNHFLASVGLGRSFALGRNGLSGTYRKIGVGFGDHNGAALLELSQYGMNYKGMTAITNFSVGGIINF